MAHELDMTRAEGSMFSGNNITPWHKLGRVVEGRLTAADAIEAAGLDWNVDLAPMYADLHGWRAEVEDHFATFRVDTSSVLGVVGNKYTPVQNVEMFDFLDAIVDSGDAHYETAGSLRGGANVWMLLKPNAEEITLNGDRMEKYLLATTSHDGSSSVRVKPVVTRVVCANTLGWSLGEKSNEFRARHTAGVTGKVQQAREALRLSFAYFAEFETTARTLADIDMELGDFRSLIDTLVPMVEDGKRVEGRAETIRENKRAGILRAYNGPLTDVRPSAWKAVQAINTFELWGSDERANAEKQARRVIAGQDAPLTQRAVNLLVRK